jgi:hypothetical protein
LPSNCYKIVITLPLNCIAASLFQRCIGVLQRPIPMPRYGSIAALVGFQRPALMQHRGSSAALVVSDSTLGFRPLVDSSASFLCKISAPASQWCFSATYFYAVFGFNAALTDSNGPFLRSLAAPAPHGWTPAFHAHATSCEQRLCTRDTSKQVQRRSLAAFRSDGCLRQMSPWIPLILLWSP